MKSFEQGINIVSALNNEIMDDISPIKTDVFSCLLESYEKSDRRIIREIRKDGVLLYAK